MILLLTKLLLTAIIVFVISLGLHKLLEPEYSWDTPSEKEKKVLDILEKVFAYAFLAIVVLFVILSLLIVWFI